MKKFRARDASKMSVILSRQEVADNFVQVVPREQVQHLKGRRENWTNYQKEILISIAQEQHVLGNLVNGNPTATIWNKMTVTFNHRLGLNRRKQQLKDAWKNLRRDFRKYYNLANRSGWRWNYELGLPETTDDVWKELLQANPEYKALRKKPFPFYQMLESLTRNTFAMSHHRRTTQDGEVQTRSLPEQENVKDMPNDPFAVRDIFIDKTNMPDANPYESSPITPTMQQRLVKSTSDDYPSSEASSNQRHRQSEKDVQLMQKELQERVSFVQKTIDRSQPFTFFGSMEKLNGIPNLTEIGYIALVDILQINPDKRTVFMMARADCLRAWITHIISQDNKWSAFKIWND